MGPDCTTTGGQSPVPPSSESPASLVGTHGSERGAHAGGVKDGKTEAAQLREPPKFALSSTTATSLPSSALKNDVVLVSSPPRVIALNPPQFSATETEGPCSMHRSPPRFAVDQSLGQVACGWAQY
jgi:hypothetical protein